MGKNMRKKYMDNIRWMTVVLVVLYHVVYMFNGVETAGVIGPFSETQYQDAFQYIVYPWFMLLLFVVSGACARYYLENHTHKEFIKSRTRKLLVPSTIGLFVFQWILGYYNMQISGAFDSMGSSVPGFAFYLIMAVSGTGVLWYIQMLWVFSVLLVLFRSVEKDRLFNLCKKVNIPVLLGLSAAVWGMAQCLNTPVIVVYRFGIYGTGFLIGYLCISHGEVMERLQGWWAPLTLSAVLLGAAFTVCYWGKPYAEHEVLDTPLCNVFAWITVLAVLAFMKKWGDFENRCTVWMGRKAWGLYIFHYLPLAACAWHLTSGGKQIPAIYVYPAVLTAAFAGAFLLNECISRIPVVRWCVLGIRKE